MADSEPLLSVIIPVYNVLEHLADMASTAIARDIDWVEYIFIDDCSTDGTKALLMDIAKRYSSANIRIIRHEHNKGLAGARNTGIRAAHGHYLWHIDSDDFIDPNSYAYLHELLDCKHYDIVTFDFEMAWVTNEPKLAQVSRNIVSSDYGPALSIARKIRTVPSPARSLPKRMPLTREDGAAANLLRDQLLYSWLYIVKKTIHQNILYPEDRLFEDISTVPKLFLAADRFYYLPITLLYYKQRSDSFIGSIHQHKPENLRKLTNLSSSINSVIKDVFNGKLTASEAEHRELERLNLQMIITSIEGLYLSKLWSQPQAQSAIIDDVAELKSRAAAGGRYAVDLLHQSSGLKQYWVAKLILYDFRLFKFAFFVYGQLRIIHGPIKSLSKKLAKSNP